MRKMMRYTILVGNIGNIPADTKKEALTIFDQYVEESKNGHGRASGEHVTLFEDDEPLKEYFSETRIENDESYQGGGEIKKYSKSVWLFKENSTSDDEEGYAYIQVEAKSPQDALNKINSLKRDKKTFLSQSYENQSSEDFMESGWNTDFTWEIDEGEFPLVKEGESWVEIEEYKQGGSTYQGGERDTTC